MSSTYSPDIVLQSIGVFIFFVGNRIHQMPLLVTCSDATEMDMYAIGRGNICDFLTYSTIP